MSFEALVIAFAERFLSDRTFQLIVLPALADLQFEDRQRSFARTASRLAVLRAVAGGVRDDLARDWLTIVTLTFVPTCYYIFALVLCFDVLSISLTRWCLVAATLILILSVGQAVVCFWPDRTARSIE